MLQIETRNLGIGEATRTERETERAVGTALARFADRIHRVRVRLIPSGDHEITCRVRVWCGHGDTLVVEKHAPSAKEAINAVSDILNRSLRQRWSSRRARRGSQPLSLGKRESS